MEGCLVIPVAESGALTTENEARTASDRGATSRERGELSPTMPRAVLPCSDGGSHHNAEFGTAHPHIVE